MQRSFRMAFIVITACLPAVALVGCATGHAGKSSKKIKITKLDELPQHTYPVSVKASEMVKSADKIARLAQKVRSDVEGDLATYEINDATTLKRLYGTLLQIDLIENKYDSALSRFEQIRGLEDKEASKLTTGLVTKAAIAARREAGRGAGAATYKRAFRRYLDALLAELPWDVVGDTIKENKGRQEIFSETFFMGLVQAQMDPVVEQTGELNADLASAVLSIHYRMKERLPLRDDTIAAYQKMIDDNKVARKPDIWAARTVTLSQHQNLNPVLMAVWDSGTDVKVFEDFLWTNPQETLNGKDDDHNGYIDDVHGIAYDIHARRTTGLLCGLGSAADRLPDVMSHMKGFMDLLSAIDSPEASALKQHLAGLDPGSVEGFIEDLGLAGNYAHGTHVAGLMVDGNPFARLLIARLSYDHNIPPVARTADWGKRDGAKCRDTVAYFQKQGVRVVNMSWGEALADAESSLEQNGIGDSAEQRRAMAREVFGYQKEGLYEAIKGAPDILFVCAAGNADNDVEFEEHIASSFDLPNLLVVGAVDQAGDPTSFTSFGGTVQVYANGFEVDSYVPGGKRMKMSGTSMASPNVANLAGKILATSPKLTPPQVIALIKKGADMRTTGETALLLMNPKRTLQLME